MNRFVAIDVGQLRIGMYVCLEVGWLHHPFPVSNFKIATQEQLGVIQALGVASVQVDLSKSDKTDAAPSSEQMSELAGVNLDDGLEWWREKIRGAQSRYLSAVSISESVYTSPLAHLVEARAGVDSLIAQQVAMLAQKRDLSLHLLADAGSTTWGVHSVNVAVLSLLLGKTLGLLGPSLQDLGAAALLHDIGKPRLNISASACALNQSVATAQHRETAYASHVGESVSLALSMGYSPQVTTAIAQHHEWSDGSGFPLGLLDGDMDMAGKILALTNNYERLCCLPLQGVEMTPHEAIVALYGQYPQRYSPHVLEAFVQTIGVYPPGSLVELSDARVGVVVSVNTRQTLKPQVLVYEPRRTLKHIDLQEYAGLGIRRGLTRHQLPRRVLEALQPQKRLCYFFDDSVAAAAGKESL